VRIESIIASPSLACRQLAFQPKRLFQIEMQGLCRHLTDRTARP